jgi:ribonuclease HII
VIAGIDEVGRGCIAGPVIAAIVVLDPQHSISGLTDSKKLTDKKRRTLAESITQSALTWAIGRAEVSEIDRINILQASLLAMRRAYLQIQLPVTRVLVDGNYYPDIDCPGETIIQGDLTVAEISAASILAKVARDDEMIFLNQLFPGYGLADHKGYPTKYHLQQLQLLGISEIHRKSFAPVKRLLKRA